MNVPALIRKYNISFIFFLVSVFALCFSRKLFIISLWPWFFFWIIEGSYLNKINKRTFQKGKWAIILLPSIFAVFLISLIWSSDITHGKISLGEKLSLILIPFFIVFSQQNNSYQDRFNLVQKTFLAGLISSSVFLLLVALIKAASINNGVITFNPVVNKWGNVFLYYNFSYLIHPSYYAMMHLLGLAFCLQDIKNGVLFRKAYINTILIIYFTIIIILTSSRAGYITLLLVVFYYILSTDIKYSIKITFGIILVILSLFYFNHATRFTNMLERYEINTQDSRIVAFFKTNIRYDLWISSFNILKDKPVLGSGIGDVQKELNKEYHKLGNNLASERSLNAHNQFLESWLASGIPGLIILLISLYLPLADKNLLHKEYYIYFLIIITTSFLFESILNRIWGVAFFSIFYTLLTRRSHSR